MKKRVCILCLLLIICFTFCSCTKDQSPPANSTDAITFTQSETTLTAASESFGEKSNLQLGKPEQTFPFKDEEDRLRYRLIINGKEIETEHYPFTYPNEPKGGYYPVKDVLAHFGVECLSGQDETILTTKINDKVLTVTAGVKKMTYGSKAIEPITAVPVVIDSCLYAPSVVFMMTFEDGVVGFSADGKAVTLYTNTVIDLAASGIKGLNVPGSAGNGTVVGGGKDNISGAQKCGTCGGTGRSICTYCSGTGSKIEYQQTFDPTSHQYKTVQKNVFCPRCGGSGRVVCPSCGGTGTCLPLHN